MTSYVMPIPGLTPEQCQIVQGMVDQVDSALEQQGEQTREFVLDASVIRSLSDQERIFVFTAFKSRYNWVRDIEFPGGEYGATIKIHFVTNAEIVH